MADKTQTKSKGSSISGDAGNISPVIDLRELDQGAGATTAGPATSNPPAGTQPTAAQPAAASQAKKPGINLEDEAMLAQAQTVIAPPEKFIVPTLVKEKFPDLMQLIKETESMNDDERNYWFQILPIMTEDQIRKFRDILINEKSQLTRLDKEYEDEITRLNQKHMVEWREFESKEKREAIKTAEEKSKKEEQAAEEDLLRRLSQH
jgi:hypothetical protein